MKFELNDQVVIECSGEQGKVIGRAEYASATEPSYFIRYKCGDGRGVESWWSESALLPAG